MFLKQAHVRRCRLLVLAIVFTSVFSLTANLATRYCFPADSSIQSVKVVKVPTSPDAKKQRLNKNAAVWFPPVLSFTELQVPRFYPKFAPAGPHLPDLFLEESLYNRPPPLSIS
jgi:hypothetical protein